jgi:hypothetical protein
VKSLLILSAFGRVHYGDYAQREGFWCACQQRFIAATTDDYDHAVYLNRSDRQLFPGAIIVGENHGPHTVLEAQKTLRALLEFARSHPYAYYLILDSDAFPVRRGWLPLLLQKMGARRFAAPVRYENLDTFPHPCALFIKGEAITDAFDFAPSFQYRNLLGEPALDLGSALPREHWFPLIRSNRCNVHPVLAAVYYDVFYHHGGGSRRVFLRSVMQGYYEHLVGDADAEEKQAFAALQQDPEGFIRRLRGIDMPATGSDDSGQRHRGF